MNAWLKLLKPLSAKLLENQKLSYEELETVLIQIENIVNSRPLTFITTEEVCEPLTPSHLIYRKDLYRQLITNI